MNTYEVARRVKDKIDCQPVRRLGWPWSRWNYIRRVDAYNAVDAALREMENDAKQATDTSRTPSDG